MCCSIKYSRELSRTTTSFGASFRSDKDSVGRIGADGTEIIKPKHISAKRLYSMVRPDWIYGVVGTIGAFIAGAQMPLFALGVSQALVAFYMDWDTTRHEVRKISLLFCSAAVLTVIVHAIEHLCFGTMGERLTLRVREMMFSGMFQLCLIVLFSKALILHAMFKLEIAYNYFNPSNISCTCQSPNYWVAEMGSKYFITLLKSTS